MEITLPPGVYFVATISPGNALPAQVLPHSWTYRDTESDATGKFQVRVVAYLNRQLDRVACRSHSAWSPAVNHLQLSMWGRCFPTRRATEQRFLASLA